MKLTDFEGIDTNASKLQERPCNPPFVKVVSDTHFNELSFDELSCLVAIMLDNYYDQYYQWQFENLIYEMIKALSAIVDTKKFAKQRRPLKGDRENVSDLKERFRKACYNLTGRRNLDPIYNRGLVRIASALDSLSSHIEIKATWKEKVLPAFVGSDEIARTIIESGKVGCLYGDLRNDVKQEFHFFCRTNSRDYSIYVLADSLGEAMKMRDRLITTYQTTLLYLPRLLECNWKILTKRQSVRLSEADTMPHVRDFDWIIKVELAGELPSAQRHSATLKIAEHDAKQPLDCFEVGIDSSLEEIQRRMMKLYGKEKSILDRDKRGPFDYGYRLPSAPIHKPNELRSKTSAKVLSELQGKLDHTGKDSAEYHKIRHRMTRIVRYLQQRNTPGIAAGTAALMAKHGIIKPAQKSGMTVTKTPGKA